MRTRVHGLQTECDLIVAELELCRSGERREFDYDGSGNRIDITPIWIDYLRAQLAMKRSLIARLKSRYGRNTPAAAQPPAAQTGDPAAGSEKR